MPTTTTTQIGTALEGRAADFLQAKGLTLLGRQIRVHRGEIDLLMADQDAIVFVEVRYRRHTKLGDGAETVDWTTRARLKRAAATLLAQRTELAAKPCRFDVISGHGPAESPHWTWYRDAFSLQ